MKLKKYAIFALLVGVAGLVLCQPANEGAPYNPYFDALNQELRTHGTGTPTLVLDLDRIDHNITAVRALFEHPDQLRIVAKSLPSLPLLNYIMNKSGSNRLMVFHAPFLATIAHAFPGADLLIGKPMPVRAVETVFSSLGTTEQAGLARQTQWLVDTRERLLQYKVLAEKYNLNLRINIEIDVGLHRGGVPSPDQLSPMLEILDDADSKLHFSGFMGYDAHLAAAPTAGDKVQAMQTAASELLVDYGDFVNFARLNFPSLLRIDSIDSTFNGGGSKTFMLYRKQTVVNDLALGSGFLKPTEYDVPQLRDLQPAFFIATPVLKEMPGAVIPFVEFLAPLWRFWDPNRQHTWFMYSGGWMAHYVSPEGLRNNPLYGFSTNQAMVNGSNRIGLNVDDMVFLRPTQSEKVLLQMGDLTVVRDGHIVDLWPVLRQ